MQTHTKTHYENTQIKRARQRDQQASQNRQSNRERICCVLVHYRRRNTANCNLNHGEPITHNENTNTQNPTWDGLPKL